VWALVGTLAGMAHPRRWSIEHDVREDADSIFIPTALLPDARPGDTVEIRTADTVIRRGDVVDRIADHVRGDFVTVRLDAPDPRSRGS
jgi:hypothetical protein